MERFYSLPRDILAMKLTSLIRRSNAGILCVQGLSGYHYNTIPSKVPTRLYLSSYHKMPSQKHPKYGHLPLSTSGPLECALTGSILLNNPIFNKGSAFPSEERREFNLTGLLPQSVQTLEQQANRAYQQFSSAPDDLAKNAFMTSMST